MRRRPPGTLSSPGGQSSQTVSISVPQCDPVALPIAASAFYPTRRALSAQSAAQPLPQWGNRWKSHSPTSGKSLSAPSTSAHSFLSRGARPFASDCHSPLRVPGAAADQKGTVSSSSPETTTSFPSTGPHYCGWPAGESRRSSKDGACAREPRRPGKERNR